MKSLHLEELKKNEAIPDSYEISVAYRGVKWMSFWIITNIVSNSC